jgi:hypothetical protein
MPGDRPGRGRRRGAAASSIAIHILDVLMGGDDSVENMTILCHATTTRRAEPGAALARDSRPRAARLAPCATATSPRAARDPAWPAPP